MIEKNKIVALIPARGGSKGIKNKNIIDLCGKPLISYTIQAALESKYIDKVIVSTDSQEIADVAIMPSIYQEAAGLVALEAQAAGLPIIISNVGGISEFVHPQSSLKINIDDNFINSLANMINEISLNKDLYNYEKKLSQQYINRFNIDEYSKKFIDVFNRFS